MFNSTLFWVFISERGWQNAVGRGHFKRLFQSARFTVQTVCYSLKKKRVNLCSTSSTMQCFESLSVTVTVCLESSVNSGICGCDSVNIWENYVHCDMLQLMELVKCLSLMKI